MQQLDAQSFWDERGPAYFRELSTFGALPDAVVLKMLTGGRVLQLDRGEELYRLGDRTGAFYIVLDGGINNYVPGYEDGKVISRHHEPGDDMGFVHMISLNDRTATAIAEQVSIVLEISADQFLELHDREPDAFGLLLLNLTRGMARTVITMAGMIADLDKRLQTLSRIASLPCATPSQDEA